MKCLGIALFAGMVGCAFVQSGPAAEAPKFKEDVLYSFGGGTDGANPAAGVIEVKGTLYGATFKGGTSSSGTVFSVDPKTGAEIVLHAFGSGSDGTTPYAGLIAVKGTLYGTTLEGGSNDGCGSSGCGTVYSLDPGTGAEKVLYSFCSQEYCTDGANPYASLLAVNGTIYGTTVYGGNNNDGTFGTAFALDRKTGAERVVYPFCSQQNCTDGAWPLANLIDVNGTLYGTTNGGGSPHGTVFALDPKTGAETVLYSFGSQQNDGAYPYAGLIDVNGLLYGTTSGGGSGTGCSQTSGCGTVFSVNPGTGEGNVVYSFCTQQNCTDGAYPSGNLIAVKGKLYGTTPAGGANCQSSGGCGTVFALDPGTGAEKVLYSFCRQLNCADGDLPDGLIDVNGTLYGTTSQGGANCQSSGGCGTVFALKNP